MFVTSPSKERLAARKHSAIAAEHEQIADMIEATGEPEDATSVVILAMAISCALWVGVILLGKWMLS